MNVSLIQQSILYNLFFFGVGFLVSLGFLPRAEAQELSGRTLPLMELSAWEYHWGDAPLDAQGVPVWTYEDMPANFWQPIQSIELLDSHPLFAWIRIPLPKRLPGSAVLATDVVATSFEAYVDSTLIYRFGTLQPGQVNKYALNAAQLIPLPDDAEGRMLYLRIYSPYPDYIGAHLPILLATEGTILRTVFRRNLGQLVAGIIILVSGLIVMLLSFQATDPQRTLMLLHFSIFSVCLGIFYIGSCFFASLIFSVPPLWYYLVILFYLFPVGVLGFLEQVVERRFKRWIRRLWQVHLVFFFVVLLLDVLNIALAPSWFTAFFLLLTVSFIACGVAVVSGIRSGQREAQIFGVGLLIVIVATLYDSVVLGFDIAPNNPFVSQWGVVLFLLLLGYLLARQFAENTHRLQVYSQELEAQSEQLLAAKTSLEDYSNTLAQKVEERTTELKGKNEELADTVHQLRTTQQQLVLHEKMVSLGQLTAGIAHEIKNPLNFVNNFAVLSVELADELAETFEANRDKPLTEVADDFKELLQNLKQNAVKINEYGQRADGIVSNMLMHARGKPGKPQTVSLNALVEEFVVISTHSLQAQVPDFSIEVKREYDERVTQVQVMPQEIGRVLFNLLNNAFYAVHLKWQSGVMPYTPMVRVSTREQGELVEIRVWDNGDGMPEEVQQKVFEPFFTMKPTGTGTGLGMSLSYDIIVQGHGGTLGVESEEGQGATFIVSLPLNQPMSLAER